MTAFYQNEDGLRLLYLLLAHVLTDFFLQPNEWVSDKKLRAWRSPYLYLHSFVAGALSLLLLHDLSLWWAAGIIAITHLLIDGWKIGASRALSPLPISTEQKAKKELKLFLLDQFAHLLLIIIVWKAFTTSHMQFPDFIIQNLGNHKLLFMLLGYLIVLGPAGHFIGFVTRRWTDELNVNDSLSNAGKWIGMLERLIILTVVYQEQFAVIGFLITAKSLLRVIDRPEPVGSEPGFSKPFSSRKHTEYVLIGTFLSFAIALITGIVINSAYKL